MKIAIAQTIHDNLGKIQPYLQKQAITAYRLINHNPEIPLAVDIYQDNAVVHIFDPSGIEYLEELQAGLKNDLQIVGYYFKNRTRVDLQLPVSPSKTIILNENGHLFKVNLSDYQDTGLFLDHRETRLWLAALSRNKSFLNTFAYTGSFSVYAAAAGAANTCSVDISRVYGEWTAENLTLNKLQGENNRIYKMDTLEFFQYARKKGMDFDIILIDPPTFSRNKSRSFGVQKDHPALINGALELLRQDGFILFSTNYSEFRMSQKDLRPCHFREKTDSIPPDFKGSQPHRCFIISK